ncbi:MAG: AAA family ATPase [Methanosarcinales archaeon]|nr:AAA family ATPase [Methanosarcinales archaeon]
MKIIGFVGMPGSGKSEASRVAREMGLEVVIMGDVIRAEARRRSLDPTDSNLGMVGNSLREKDGAAAIARGCLAMIRGGGVVVVDGIRSLAEVEFFRDSCRDFHLVEVYAPPQSRLGWIASRGRPDDSAPGPAEAADARVFSPCDPGLRHTAEALERRECRELGWGMCEAIQAADIRISNDGSLEEFQEKVRAILEGLSR